MCEETLEQHWRQMSRLAFASRGITIDLAQVPAYVRNWILDEHNRYVEENQKK